ncbi:hypothetical protein EI94DRAFT_1601674 [Lactarius quietus]|nr:hypothetical protein EI94DRAFT_1601674 [Lactarius quietus]
MSLLTFVLFYTLVFVRALPLVKRIVVSPPITSPTTSTIWTVGNQVTVTWDTSSIPPPNNFTGELLLGYLTSGSTNENLNVGNPLAANFPLSAGSVGFTSRTFRMVQLHRRLCVFFLSSADCLDVNHRADFAWASSPQYSAIW